MERKSIALSSRVSPTNRKTALIKLAAWISSHNLAFIIISIGMIVMLFWAGAFKMTVPGSEGIAPLVNNSPLISWHYKIFGPHVGGDIIGLTEWIAGLLILTGFWKPKAGIVGSIIAVVMFFITSSMLITTPGATIQVNGMRYMNNLGLFLYKDIINLGASFYLISYFGRKAINVEKDAGGQ